MTAQASMRFWHRRSCRKALQDCQVVLPRQEGDNPRMRVRGRKLHVVRTLSTLSWQGREVGGPHLEEAIGLDQWQQHNGTHHRRPLLTLPASFDGIVR